MRRCCNVVSCKQIKEINLQYFLSCNKIVIVTIISVDFPLITRFIITNDLKLCAIRVISNGMILMDFNVLRMFF